MKKFLQAIKPRKTKYGSIQGRLSMFILHLAYVIEGFLFLLTLGCFRIELSEYLLFQNKFIRD